MCKSDFDSLSLNRLIEELERRHMVVVKNVPPPLLPAGSEPTGPSRLVKATSQRKAAETAILHLKRKSRFETQLLRLYQKPSLFLRYCDFRNTVWS